MKLTIKNSAIWKNSIIEIGSPCFGTSTESFFNDFLQKGENDSGHLYFIRSVQNELAGYLLLSIVEDEAEVIQIAVKEIFRRKGFSTVLLNEVFRYCEQICVKSIFLEVRKSNEAALNLYRKSGFIEIGTRKKYYSDPDEDAIVMKHKLSICK